MILNGCMASGGLAVKLGPPLVGRNPSSSLPPISRISASIAPPRFKSPRLYCERTKEFSFRVAGGSSLDPSSLSRSSFSKHCDASYMGCTSSRRHKLQIRNSLVPKALKNFSYPQMTEKPQWWWRSLACVPYLLSIADSLMCAENGFHIKSFLEELGFFTHPLLDTLAVMPSWFLMAFSFSVYIFVVRRKEVPHFLRFHVIMAMLLGTAAQIVTVACDWLPRSVYRGAILQRIWITFALMLLFTVFECIRCALSGSYADVPFVSDAAYIHSYIR